MDGGDVDVTALPVHMPGEAYAHACARLSP